MARGPNRRWQLDATDVTHAWRSTRGNGVIIAIIDEAVDTRHAEFQDRVIEGRDVEAGGEAAIPQGWQPHGTKCAGVACAAGLHVSGVAPEARLMPIRVPSLARTIGTPAEADAIRWAAEHGADVICCAWGPSGRLTGPVDMPRRTRDAVEWAVTKGRQGKGCAITWSAGNDNIDLAWNGYANSANVIAVGACNDHQKRSRYSNWGDALWCVFPSSDPNDPNARHREISTTTPVGSFQSGETYYTDSFGFTSAACAGVAGICALILSANPSLAWWEVKEVLRDSCVRIDGDGGTYAESGRSPYYGYGRPNAAAAVRIASEHPSASA